MCITVVYVIEHDCQCFDIVSELYHAYKGIWTASSNEELHCEKVVDVHFTNFRQLLSLSSAGWTSCIVAMYEGVIAISEYQPKQQTAGLGHYSGRIAVHSARGIIGQKVFQ